MAGWSMLWTGIQAAGVYLTQCSAPKVAASFTIILFLWLVFELSRYRGDPLRAFPGPWPTRFSNFSYCRTFLGGRQPYQLLKLHEKYGPVVRVAPNELSFNTQTSWRDIYAKRPGHKTFIKSDFYDGGNFAAEAHSIVSERDPDEHGAMKASLRDVFSDSYLREQEQIIASNVDLFIHKIGDKGASQNGIDMVMWYNLVTFDIIGSLAFGESFEGVSSGTEHFWVSIIVKSLRMGALADSFKRFPCLSALVQRIFSGTIRKLIEDTRKHEAYAMTLIHKRTTKKSNRKDFLTKMLENRDRDKTSDVQLAAHASDFIIAGSETTATALACITYYLCKTPCVRDKLQAEICLAFETYDEIDGASTANLSYLNAIILEALRIYPPLPFALPRVVPKGGDNIDGHFVPEGTVVSTNPFAASMSSKNFHDPWKFDPERWLKTGTNDTLGSSQPFSLGPRVCLGRSLAWLELRTVLAKLYFCYDLTLLDQSLDWHAESEMHTLWQKPALYIRILPRGT